LVRRELRRRLRAAVQKATIVQMDDGGYPVMLGQEAWRIATRLGKRRIWVFDGADPFPRLALQAARQKSPIKRMAIGLATQRKIAFCRRVIAQADLVFAHNASVVDRFKDVWNGHCHAFDRSFVTEDLLIGPQELRLRATLLRDASVLRLLVAGRQI